MNRSFKSIWSEAQGAWVAVSEVAAGRGKKSRSGVRASIVALSVTMALAALPAAAQTQINSQGVGGGGDASAGLTVGQVAGSTTGFLTARVALTADNVFGLTGNTMTAGMQVYNTATTTGANGVNPGLYTWNGSQWISNSVVSYFHTNSQGAIGNATLANSGAIGVGSIAVGSYAQSKGTSTIAIGQGARTVENGTVSIGYQAGTLVTTPGNASFGLNGAGSVYIGNQTGAVSDANAVYGTARYGSGPGGATGYNTYIGALAGLAANGGANTFIGASAGQNSKGDGNVYIGPEAGEGRNGVSNVALGDGAGMANGLRVNNAVMLGASADVMVNGGVALGAYSIASTAGGAAGYAPATISAAAQSAITATNSTTLGAVSVGSGAAGGNRQIVNVAAGTNDADAVNVSQLKAVEKHYFSVNSVGGGNALNNGAAGADAVAIGKGASANSDNTVAIGNTNGVTGTQSIGIGYQNTVNGTNNSVVGQSNTVTGNSNAIMGDPNTVVGSNNVGQINNSNLFGNRNVASGNNLTIGTSTTPVNSNVVLGDTSGTQSSNTVAVGNNIAVAAGVDGAVVLGNNSTVAASTVASYNPGTGVITGTALGSNVVSVGSVGGERRITNLAAGGADTDAVNVSQLKAVSSAAAAGAIHYYSVNDGGVPGGNYANDGATGVNAFAAGVGASASTAGGVALGSGAVSDRGIVQAVGNYGSGIQAVGFNTTDRTLLGAVSVGNSTGYRQIINVADGTQASDAVTVRQLSGALGALASTPTKYFHANSTAGDSLAVGTESIAIGPQTVVNANNGVGIGSGATVQASATGGIAIGAGASVTQSGGVALGVGSIASTAAGVKGYVPTGASTAQTAAVMATTSTLAGMSVGNAATGQLRQVNGVAAGSVDSDAVNVSQLKAVQTAVVNIDNNAVKYDTNTNGTTNYNSVTLGNSNSNSNSTGPVTLGNVANGVAPNDAVNVQQLNAGLASANAYTDARVNGLQGHIDGVAKKAYAGVASAMALESAPYVPGKTTYAAGTGYYQSQGAVGIALRRTADNGRWSVTGGVSASAGGVAVRAGVSGIWD